MAEALDLNILGLSEQSLLMVLIVLLVLQCYGVLKCTEGLQEGASAAKQRFAGVLEGYYGSGLTGANYNGGHLNFESNAGPGKVISSGRGLDTMEGLNLVDQEGLNLVDQEGYLEGLKLVE